MVDWGTGSYEESARQLRPASEVAVGLTAPSATSRVLDLGCGTGNAALLAAETGAQVVALDPSARLLRVARERALAVGANVSVVQGAAEDLPLASGSMDVVLSVFGVIFCPDPARAAAECSRVLAEHGRIVLAVWPPDSGPVQEMVSAIQRLLGEALGGPPPPEGFPWHDPTRVGELFAGFAVTATDHELTFQAESVAAYLEESDRHPLSVAGREMLAALGRADVMDDVRAVSVEVLTRGNTASEGFCVPARYRVLVCER